jgi:ABC-2 type transport system permease protein
MSLSLLLKDELRGFYKSKVMIFLWVGLPALSLLLFVLEPSGGDISLPALTAMLVGSLGGVLAAVMLVVSIVNERERHVFDLFVIRPIRRRDIVLSKFAAVYLCVAAAALLAFGVAVGVDLIDKGEIPAGFASTAVDFLVISLSMMAISCSAGVLIGVFSPSVLVGVILVMYGANQLSAVTILPVLTVSSSDFFPLLPGAAITTVLLILAILVFNKKQL